MPRYDVPNAAPEPLRTVQRFLNTVDLEHGRDWLPTPDALAEWLAEAGFPIDGKVSEADLRRAIDLREALRSLTAVNGGHGKHEAGAIAVINHSARAGGLTVGLDADGTVQLECAAPGFDGALCRLLPIVFGAMLDGTWPRLKSCPQCRWAFYDYSKNRSASWCSMKLCGNRAKTRAFRARRQSPRASKRR